MLNRSKACDVSGLMVPYERDWEEVVGSSESQYVRGPEPGKIAGYAFVVNKMKCPQKEVQAIFNTIEWHTPLKPGMHVGDERPFRSFAVNPNVEMQPKWLPQVIKRIESAALSSAK